MCGAQNTNPFASDPRAAESGRLVFRIFCAPCHGINARGGKGPDLTTGGQDGDLFNVIARGIAGSEMQGYADRIDNDNIWRLVSYVRSVARHDAGAVAGDIAAGENIFWAKGCGGCHRIGARGASIGPDLSRIGRQRGVGYLRTSIEKPDADIATGFATVRVVMPDGTSIAGVQRNLDNFSVQLVDLRGHYHSFVREDVKAIERETRSLMPPYSLPERELTDLVAYLSSLRGAR